MNFFPYDSNLMNSYGKGIYGVKDFKKCRYNNLT